MIDFAGPASRLGTTAVPHSMKQPIPFLVLFTVVLLSVGRASGQSHQIQDLGPGIALDINSSGKVVGVSDGFGFHFDGVTWESVTRLAMPNWIQPSEPPDWIPAASSSLVAINDSGERVGTVTTTTGIHAVVRISGTNMTSIDNRVMPIYPPVVTGLNDLGLVSGWQVSAPYGHNNGIQIGGSLGVPNFSRLHAVNASGTFAGSWGAESPAFRDFRAYPCRAIVVSPTGTMTVIDSRVLPDRYLSFADDSSDENHWSDAYGINASGTVVGAMRSATGTPRHAFRSVGSAGATLVDLGTLGGARSMAYDINTDGQIVGEAETTNGVMHAFRWSNGVMIDLNSLLRQPADAGWELLTAKAINDRGEIVGQGRFQGSLRAFLLSPPGLVSAPWIKASPQRARLTVGQDLTLAVEAGGIGPLAYQWMLNGTPIPGATNATHRIPYATGRDAGDYAVRVANPGGIILSRSAKVEVLDPELTIETFVGLRITGEAGATYEVQSRPSATSAQWTALTRITLVTTNQSWIDPESHRNPGRLYRAVRQP